MKHLVLIGVLLSLGIVPFVLRRVPQNSSRSLSQHIVKDRRTIMMAQIMFVLVASMVMAWYFGWYVAAHTTFAAQAILLVAICVLAALSGLVPYHEGTRAGKWHNVFAWTYAYILPVLIGTFLLTSSHIASYVIIAACVIWQLWVVVAYRFYPPAKPYFLQYQLSYIGVFAVALLTATYIG